MFYTIPPHPVNSKTKKWSVTTRRRAAYDAAAMVHTQPKRFLTGTEVLHDSFRLARLVDASAWEPDLLIILWRGGAPIGIAVHEYFVYKHRRKDHRVIACRSYAGTEPLDRLDIAVNEQDLAMIRPGRRVLIIDDIFDTGRTAMRIKELVVSRGAEARIATLFWKPANNRTAGRPDYYLHQTDQWVVFPHELEGLTPEEVRQKGPVVYDVLHGSGERSAIP